MGSTLATVVILASAWDAQQDADLVELKRKALEKSAQAAADQANVDKSWKEFQASRSEAEKNVKAARKELDKALKATPIPASLKSLMDAVDTASAELRKGTPAIQPLPLDEAASRQWVDRLVSVTLGAAVFSGFTIKEETPGNFVIDSSNRSDAGFAMDFNLSSRHAWMDDLTPGYRSGFWNPRVLQNGAVEHSWNGLPALDYQVRLGATLSGDSGDKFSATQIAGAGDFYLETCLGLVILNIQHGNALRHTFNIEGYGSFVTERENLQIRATYGIGGAIVSAFPSISKLHPTQLFLGGYWGNISVPALVDENLDDVESKLGKYPDFDARRGVFTKFQLRMPISDNSWLDLNGIFAHQLEDSEASIDPWSITLGMTLSLGGLAKIFSPVTSLLQTAGK